MTMECQSVLFDECFVRISAHFAITCTHDDFLKIGLNLLWKEIRVSFVAQCTLKRENFGKSVCLCVVIQEDLIWNHVIGQNNAPYVD